MIQQFVVVIGAYSVIADPWRFLRGGLAVAALLLTVGLLELLTVEDAARHARPSRLWRGARWLGLVA